MGVGDEEISFSAFEKVMRTRSTADIQADSLKRAFKVFATKGEPVGHLELASLREALQKHDAAGVASDEFKQNLLKSLEKGAGGGKTFNYAAYVDLMLGTDESDEDK